MVGRHSFSELRAKMSPEARAHADRKTRALQRLIDHPDERLALGQRAVARARRFSIDRTAAAYARLYEDVLA